MESVLRIDTVVGGLLGRLIAALSQQGDCFKPRV